MRRMMPDSRFCECIFNLTLMAADHLREVPKEEHINLRDLFNEVYAEASEFEFGEDGCMRYYDDGNYQRDIEAFGQERLNKWFEARRRKIKLYRPGAVVVKRGPSGACSPRMLYTYMEVRSLEKAKECILSWKRDHGLDLAAEWVTIVDGDNSVRVGKRVNIAYVKDLWESFGDVPVDPETDRLEEPWGDYQSIGETREDVWHWFEDTFDVSVAEDLMGHENEVRFGDLVFELVKAIPRGYRIWNIGRDMLDGYLPLCKKTGNPVDSSEQIDTDSLKAIRLDGAWMILDAIGYGPENPKQMRKFVREYERYNTGSWRYEAALRMKIALPIFEKIRWE